MEFACSKLKKLLLLLLCVDSLDLPFKQGTSFQNFQSMGIPVEGDAFTSTDSGTNSESRMKPRLFIKEMVMRNFKSYAGEKRVGPFHKVSFPVY